MPQNLWILTSYDYNILLVDWCSPRITAVILHIHFFTVKSHLSSFVITLNCEIILRAKVCVCISGHIMSLAWTSGSRIRSESLWSAGLLLLQLPDMGHHQQTFACTTLVHRPLPQPASTGESSALWFLDREAGPAGQGKHRPLLSSTASPFAGLNFQLKTCKKKKKVAESGLWNLAVWKCVYSQGAGGRESRQALL